MLLLTVKIKHQILNRIDRKWGSWKKFPLFHQKVKAKVTQLCPTLCDLTANTVHGILQARILEWVTFPFSRGYSQPQDQTGVSHTADSLPAEPPGKPKNTGVGGLSLLQQIFPTQEFELGSPALQAESLPTEL